MFIISHFIEGTWNIKDIFKKQAFDFPRKKPKQTKPINKNKETKTKLIIYSEISNI